MDSVELCRLVDFLGSATNPCCPFRCLWLPGTCGCLRFSCSYKRSWYMFRCNSYRLQPRYFSFWLLIAGPFRFMGPGQWWSPRSNPLCCFGHRSCWIVDYRHIHMDWVALSSNGPMIDDGWWIADFFRGRISE